MNSRCSICSDLFTPLAEVYTTPCGHLFHYHCLMQWIERSQTCPQCRSTSTKNTIHKVYLNVEETADLTTNTGTIHNLLSWTEMFLLQAKLKQLQCQMTLRNIELREYLKSQVSKTRVVESAMHALEDQVQSKNKECDNLQDEVRRLKDRLKNVQHVETEVRRLKDRLKNVQHVETAITGSGKHIIIIMIYCILIITWILLQQFRAFI